MSTRTVALELQPCCGQRSGIGTYAYELAMHLHDDDELRFCGNIFNFCNRHDNTGSLFGVEMPIRQCAAMSYKIYRRIWHFFPFRYDDFFKPSADLSVFFDYIVPPRISGKVITTIHDLTWRRYPETLSKRNLNRIARDIVYSIERSDKLLTVSEFSKKEIVEQLGYPAERIEVVPCAVAAMPEAADIVDLRKRFALQKPYLLYIGNIEPRKNLARLLKAFDVLYEDSENLQLVIAGGNTWGSDDMQKLLKPLRCSNDVLCVGYVQPDIKRALYENAAAFVFPSFYEGFGIPPLEAMRCACPVVCANAASLPEVVGDAAELVDPFDAADIARGIWNVISDEKRSAELILRGKQQALKFSWEASADKLRSICRAVVGLI